jgi:hypothetical protein
MVVRIQISQQSRWNLPQQSRWNLGMVSSSRVTSGYHPKNNRSGSRSPPASPQPLGTRSQLAMSARPTGSDRSKAPDMAHGRSTVCVRPHPKPATTSTPPAAPSQRHLHTSAYHLPIRSSASRARHPNESNLEHTPTSAPPGAWPRRRVRWSSHPMGTRASEPTSACPGARLQRPIAQVRTSQGQPFSRAHLSASRFPP